MDALTESLKTASEEDRGKYEYKSQRLAFEKEQAEEKRRYDADEAEKRRQHELELEGRRKKKPKRSVKTNVVEFFRTMLMQKNRKNS
ncbi:hypothetical protein GQ600_15315 [Phytophthora cactorum]|nr:hypothetical protein GQ600_15315 [Phytophthora cactorum]